MKYTIDSLPLKDLLLPISRAGDAIARLDDRIAHSRVGRGLVERAHFADAVASLYIDGELVHREDLVLHDAHMDIRSPTHDLTIAHTILRTRRQIATAAPDWPLSPEGLARLTGKAATDATPGEPGESKGITPAAEPKPQSGQKKQMEDPEPLLSATETTDADFDAELARIDAVLERSRAVLEQAPAAPRRANPLIYDEEWEEEDRLRAWQDLARDSRHLPPVLRAAILLDGWNTIAVLQHSPWLGRLLAAAALREAGTTAAHLLAINQGLADIPWEKRRSRHQKTRLLALLEGFEQAGRLGMREHDRLTSGRQQLERKLVGRRSNSRLPRLVELVLSRPLVSAAMISKDLGVTQQAAVMLAEELGLREMTGRGRYRAWGVL